MFRAPRLGGRPLDGRVAAEVEGELAPHQRREVLLARPGRRGRGRGLAQPAHVRLQALPGLEQGRGAAVVLRPHQPVDDVHHRLAAAGDRRREGRPVGARAQRRHRRAQRGPPPSRDARLHAQRAEEQVGQQRVGPVVLQHDVRVALRRDARALRGHDQRAGVEARAQRVALVETVAGLGRLPAVVARAPDLHEPGRLLKSGGADGSGRQKGGCYEEKAHLPGA
jgi:hypothetical protein